MRRQLNTQSESMCSCREPTEKRKRAKKEENLKMHECMYVCMKQNQPTASCYYTVCFSVRGQIKFVNVYIVTVGTNRKAEKKKN